MSRYINPVETILDNNGDPIVGAKLVFYEPGTTTKKTIYSDAGFATPITNPVTADANGRYTNIFLEGIYKVVQQDATGTPDTDDGAEIWSRDPVGDTASGQFELWISSTTYSIPEIVLGSDDNYYRSLVDANQGNDPASPSLAQWEQLKFGRVWNTNITYAIGDSVYGSNGKLYVAIASQSGNDPVGDASSWSTEINTKTIDIGDWDMNADTQTNVTHGLTFSKIRSVTALIRNDADTIHYDLASSNPQIAIPSVTALSTTVQLTRLVGGEFNNTLFDSTTYNRGWVVIHYID